MTTNNDDRPCAASEEFIRLPGLFRRWEFEQVIEGSEEFHIVAAGASNDGTQLFTIYCREEPLVRGGVR